MYPNLLIVKVVDYADACDTQKRDQVKEAYRKVFPRLMDDSFYFDGARAWAQEFAQQNHAELMVGTGRK